MDTSTIKDNKGADVEIGAATDAKMHSDDAKKQDAGYSGAVVSSLALLVLALTVAVVALGMMYASASDNEEVQTPAVPLAIIGKYIDPYNSTVVITQKAVTTTYSSPGSQPHHINITFFNNDMQFLVGQNSGPGTWHPEKWSRIDWTRISHGVNLGKIAYCTSVYNAPSEQMAMLVSTQGGMAPNSVMDHSILNTTGCGGFPFSILTAAP